ncbi:MAG: hypothetical protein HQ483_15975 [Rhodospirillales bacterium]|nr:hypothetical protein [Rhodospirillales bacterium]
MTIETLAVAGILFVAAVFNGPASADICRLNLLPPQIDVKTYEGSVTINTGHSSSQLAAKIGSHGRLSRNAGWVTRGLTKTSLESQIEVGVQIRQLSKNRFCIGLQKVSARIGYDQFKVYVARDLVPGSCEYRTTLDHEQAHVAIYKDQLRQFSSRFEQRLQRVAAGLRPVLVKSEKSGPAYFLQKFNIEFKQVFKQLSRETDSRQSRLDTPDNYRREQALCPVRSQRNN